MWFDAPVKLENNGIAGSAAERASQRVCVVWRSHANQQRRLDAYCLGNGARSPSFTPDNNIKSSGVLDFLSGAQKGMRLPQELACALIFQSRQCVRVAEPRLFLMLVR